MAGGEIHLDLKAPHPGQEKILRLMEETRFVVAMCGRRVGKTETGKIQAEEAVLQAQSVGWFGPSYKVIKDAYKGLSTTLAPIIKSKSNVDFIETINGGVIEFWSTHNNDDVGRSRRYNLAIIDEAQSITNLRNIWNKSIRPTLTDYRGQAAMYGTPKGRNDFDYFFRRGQQDTTKRWGSIRLITAENTTIPDLERELAEAREELPPEVYAQEYEGIPADDGGNPFGASAIIECALPTKEEDWSYRGPGRAVAYGIDLAKSHDYTVVIGIDENNIVVFMERWNKDSWPTTIAKIKQYVGGTRALVDQTGVGSPVVDELRKRGGSNYEGFIFSNESKQHIIENLSLHIQKKNIHYPRGVILKELDSFIYEFTKTGRTRYTAPQGLHDDAVYALALALEAKKKASTGAGAVSLWQ